MIIYSVRCEVDNEVAQKWESYFIKNHLDDVYNTGCFTAYEFRKLKSVATDKVVFLSEYTCRSQAKLDEYNEKHAATLKDDILSKFTGKYKATRSIYQLVSKK